MRRPVQVGTSTIDADRVVMVTGLSGNRVIVTFDSGKEAELAGVTEADAIRALQPAPGGNRPALFDDVFGEGGMFDRVFGRRR